MAQAEVGALRVRLAMDAGEFSRGSKQAEDSMDKLARRAEKLGAAIGAAFAMDALVGFARQAVTAFAQSENALAAVEAAVKSTGGTAGFATKELAKMAGQLSSLSTFDDDEILKSVTANLLTFANVVGPVFERAQVAALDLSARLGQDLQSSTIQLGKALNDPIAGLTALRRVGVAFTDSQKDMIKTLVQSGDMMKAQGIILDELGKEFGGQAEALAKTTQGQLTAAAIAFGNAMESIGAVLAPMILPVAQAVKVLAENFQELSPEMQRFIVIGTGSTAVMGAAALAVGIFAAALGAIAAPIAATVAAIGVLTGVVAAFWPNLKQVATIAATAFYDVYVSAKTWLLDALEPVIRRVQEFIEGIGNSMRRLRVFLGLDEVAAEIGAGVDTITTTVQSGMDKLKEIWTVAGVEAEKAAPVISQQLAASMVQANAKSEAAAAGMKLHAKEVLDEQKKLVEEGVKLAEKVRTPFEVMEDKVKRLDAALQANKISAKQYGDAVRQATLISQGAYAGMASNIAGSLSQVFSHSKAFAIAAALINSYEAATKALAAYPPPWNYVAAAATLAAGMAQVANIRSTTKSGGGSGGGGDGSISSSAGTATGASSAQPAGGSAGVQQGVYITLNGEQYGREQVRGLINQINEAVRDGAKLTVAAA